MKRKSPLRRRARLRGWSPDRETARLERTARAFEEAERTLGPAAGATEWEREFLSGVPERVRTYGRAFANPALADPAMPRGALSLRQRRKGRELARTVRKRTNEASEDG